MNFPVFDVPFIGAPWLIGIIAILHVFISHFGVGGGLYLPVIERHARRTNDPAMLAHLKHHAHFFLIVTGVYGASTGVGIWLAIGLGNPTATSALIHIFVLAWAVEWVVFLTEMTAATFYYYTWDKVSPETHLRIGWIYAVSSWLSLVVINGILTFMLTPGPWLGTHQMLSAYLNPGYLPSLILRTMVAWSLAGVWAFLPASRIEDPELKARVMKTAAYWVLPAFLIMPPAGLWFLSTVPHSSIEVLRGGMHGMASGNLSILTRVAMITVMSSATMGVVVYLGPWKNPQGFSRGMALALMALALTATGATEWVREVFRKPFVVREVIYSSGVRATEVAALQRDGYFPHAPWARVWAEGHGDSLEARGEAIFRGQCMACHTRDGYRGMIGLLGARDLDSTESFIHLLMSQNPTENSYIAFMPPFAGNPADAHALSLYLQALAGRPVAGARTPLAVAPAALTVSVR